MAQPLSLGENLDLILGALSNQEAYSDIVCRAHDWLKHTLPEIVANQKLYFSQDKCSGWLAPGTYEFLDVECAYFDQVVEKICKPATRSSTGRRVSASAAGAFSLALEARDAAIASWIDDEISLSNPGAYLAVRKYCGELGVPLASLFHVSLIGGFLTEETHERLLDLYDAVRIGVYDLTITITDESVRSALIATAQSILSNRSIKEATRSLINKVLKLQGPRWLSVSEVSWASISRPLVDDPNTHYFYFDPVHREHHGEGMMDTIYRLDRLLSGNVRIVLACSDSRSLSLYRPEVNRFEVMPVSDIYTAVCQNGEINFLSRGDWGRAIVPTTPALERYNRFLDWPE